MLDEQRVRKLIWDRLAELLGITIAAPLTGGGSTKALAGDWSWKALPTPLFNSFADVGNSGTSETDLVTNTIAAGQLGANGAKLKAEYGGTFLNHATATRELKLYFGGTAIFDTGALAIGTAVSGWTVYATIIRVSATVVRYMVSMETQNAPLAAYTSVGELTGLTLANTNVLKITGTAAGVGAASNDILAKMSDVDFEPAAP